MYTEGYRDQQSMDIFRRKEESNVSRHSNVL